MSFDVIVSAGSLPASAMCVHDCVSSIIENVIGYRYIYVTCSGPSRPGVAPAQIKPPDQATYCTALPSNLSDFYLLVHPTVRFVRPISFMESPTGPAFHVWRNTSPEPLFGLINKSRALECFNTLVPDYPSFIRDYVEFMRVNYETEIKLHHLRGGTRKGDYDFIQI